MMMMTNKKNSHHPQA